MAYYGFGRKDVSPLERLVDQFNQNIDVASDCSQILRDAYSSVSDTGVSAKVVPQPMLAKQRPAELPSPTTVQRTLKLQTHHITEAVSWVHRTARSTYAAAKAGVQRVEAARAGISDRIQRDTAAAQVYWTIALSTPASSVSATSSRVEELTSNVLAHASAYTHAMSQALAKPLHAMRSYFSRPATIYFRPVRQPAIAIPALHDLSYLRNVMYLGLASALAVGIFTNAFMMKTPSYAYAPARQAAYASAPVQHTAALIEKNQPVPVASLLHARHNTLPHTASHTAPNTFQYPHKSGIGIDHMVKACWSELTGLPAKGGNFNHFLEAVKHRYMTVKPTTVTITLPQAFHVKAAAVNVYPKLEQMIDSPYIRITSTYNDLRHIEDGHGWRIHGGWDIAAHKGATIRALGDGIIRPGPSNGEFFVDHGNGHVTGYAHVLPRSFAPGRYVHKGDSIARVGSTGAYKPHLHFTYIVDGEHTDPLKFFEAYGQPNASVMHIAQTTHAREHTKL